MSFLNSILVSRPKRTSFNLSRSNKLTIKQGVLYPVLCEKVIPGDKFQLSHQAFVQFAPFAQQVYQEFTLRTEYFFVPSRILWKDFEKFLVGGEDGQTDFPHPQINYGALIRKSFDLYRRFLDAGTPELYQGFIGSLFDYLNLPYYKEWFSLIRNNSKFDENIPDLYIDALPIVAYYRIISEYYRDENLQLEDITFSDLNVNNFRMIPYMINKILSDHLESGMTDLTIVFTTLLETLCTFNPADIILNCAVEANFLARRNYPKDYFTGALPFAQKGAQVNMPFSGSADVITGVSDDVGDVTAVRNSPAAEYDEDGYYLGTLMQGNNRIKQRVTFKNGLTSINDFRTAERVQDWLEKNAVGGTRYKEQILAHFGVKTKDSRLQRPEYLLGTKDPIILGNVYTTSQNIDKSGLPGAATTTASGSSVSKQSKYYATEHGYLMALISIYPKASYFKGIPKQFTELDKFDYYWPEFQHLGEQEVKNKELFINYGTSDDKNIYPDKTFGYLPRYSQYKIRNNEIHGDFRNTLISMTAARNFFGTDNNQINLNSDFIQINNELNQLNRPFAQTSDNFDHIFVDIFLNVKALRPMDYYGTPRL